MDTKITEKSSKLKNTRGNQNAHEIVAWGNLEFLFKEASPYGSNKQV